MDSVGTSSGFDSVGVTLNLAKSFDAITLLGDIGITETLPEDVPGGERDPGARIDYGFGTAFTVNHQITLTNFLSVSHGSGETLAGRDVPNARSDRASLSLGATWALSRAWFLRHTATFGLKDATDATIGLSVVYRRAER